MIRLRTLKSSFRVPNRNYITIGTKERTIMAGSNHRVQKMNYEDSKIVKEFESIEKSVNDTPIGSELDIDKLLSYKYKWYEWPHIIWLRYIVRPWEDLCMYTKRFIQRGVRGWGDSDLWNMSYYLTETILTMLVELKAIKHGYPSTENDATGNWDYDEGRWTEILDQMIDGFAVLRKCDLGEENVEWGGGIKSDEDRASLEKSMREKYPTWRLTTREEEAKVKKAFELFGKYYQCLWD